MPRAVLCVCAVVCIVWQPTHVRSDAGCKDCRTHQIVNLDTDFNKLATDPELSKYVAEVLVRLKTFKVPVHPRIRIFYERLKQGMREYAHRTADSLYVPDKYNTGPNSVSNNNSGRNQDDIAQYTTTSKLDYSAQN